MYREGKEKEGREGDKKTGGARSLPLPPSFSFFLPCASSLDCLCLRRRLRRGLGGLDEAGGGGGRRERGPSPLFSPFSLFCLYRPCVVGMANVGRGGGSGGGDGGGRWKERDYSVVFLFRSGNTFTNFLHAVTLLKQSPFSGHFSPVPSLSLSSCPSFSLSRGGGRRTTHLSSTSFQAPRLSLLLPFAKGDRLRRRRRLIPPPSPPPPLPRWTIKRAYGFPFPSLPQMQE